MNKFFGAIIAAMTLAVTPATAQVSVNSQSYEATNSRSFTYDFDDRTPTFVGGQIRTEDSYQVSARPLGSTGSYFSTGPDSVGAGLATISFSDYALPVGTLSFLWGSVDSFNSLQFFGANGDIGQLFTGSDVAVPADGNQDSSYSNRWVTFTFAPGSQAVQGVRLNSGQNAMELDSILITPGVPEPAAWGMMILGFAMVGGALRRRNAAVSKLAIA